MAEATTSTRTDTLTGPTPPVAPRFPYDDWMESRGLPVYRGYFVDDLRTVQLALWPERECSAAFMQLSGQEGIIEARVTEIPPGKTLPPLKFSLDEVVYVVEGRGLTTVWAGDDKPKKTFEWQKHSLFMLPHNHVHQLSNMQGDRPARLLHYNYLPLAMSAVQDPAFFFNNPYLAPESTESQAGEFYSEAKVVRDEQGFANGRERSVWSGNFFPDMRAWDKIIPFWGRGAGGRVVFVRFPGAQIKAHMSVFDARTYKKAHRHGPGRVIVIPAGEGYSIMWPEGEQKVVIPWHEASVFVPPDRWFHQHFNVGSAPARYLALHPPAQFSGISEKVEDRARDQIEYPDEDPFIRQKFEEELGKRGMTNALPDAAYTDHNFEWDYDADDH
ncbi:MAG TPA: cupin domain-containing protein [Dehalococcoidia bacterium]|nr:cupin domain-containing protein [Dehalococcoidia bacterium]